MSVLQATHNTVAYKFELFNSRCRGLPIYTILEGHFFNFDYYISYSFITN